MIRKKNITTASLKDLVIHLIPALTAIFLFEIIAIQIYIQTPKYHENSLVNFFTWRSTLAVGSFLLAHLSDKYSRKKTLLFTQLLGIIIIPLLVLLKFGLLILFLIGLIFVPTPIARAALIDNFPFESKVKMIGITFIAQFLPWCFYLKFSNFKMESIIIFTILALLINTLITFLFFEDRRDKKNKHSIAEDFLSKKNNKKVIYTLIALFCGQLVFFLSDTFIKKLSDNSTIFSALGMGSLIGVIIGLFYRKLPHLSVLTFCFGIGLLLSIIPIITNLIDPNLNIQLAYQLMLFANLGGFYLPFVFDVILSSSPPKYRGTACGIIEFVIGASSIIGVGSVTLFNLSDIKILLISFILFLSALIIQKRSEIHV